MVLGAMDIETKVLEANITSVREQTFGSFRFVEGTLESQSIVIGTTGMGSVNVAAACMLAIREFAPRCLISQGTAGAHNPDLHTGDLVLGQHIVNINYISTPCTAAGAGIHPESWNYIGPAGVFEENAESKGYALESNAQLLQVAQHVPREGGALLIGTLGSGDAWNREIDRIAFFHERFGTLCEDMESYAVAQVCTEMKVPHLALRVISNSEYHPEETFSPTAAEIAQRFTLELVRALYQVEMNGL